MAWLESDSSPSLLDFVVDDDEEEEDYDDSYFYYCYNLLWCV